jgi:hypothetical protein
MTPRLRTSLRTLFAFVVALHLGRIAQAQGQAPGGPPENVKMRLGPVFLNPTLALSNAGVDDNVFNDPKSGAPKSDATFTVTPRTDFWVRFGPSWLSGGVREDLVYYKENSGERSTNNTYLLSWNIPFNRITFHPTVEYKNTRERPGFEIDTRALRSEVLYTGEVDIKWFSKSAVVLKADRYQVQFDPGATFEQINLRDELNRVTTTQTVSLEYQLTPLTTIAANYQIGQDRFKYDTLRNASSTTIGAAIRFDPAALIKGSATVGYDDYRPDDPGTPGYKGITAMAALSYVFLGSTKVNGNLARGVQYSYDINQPYFIQTGGSIAIAQQLFGPLDVTALGGWQQLAYQSRVGAVVLDVDRFDHVTSIGAGLGYHLSRDTRVGFTIERDRRNSPVANHQYTGLRYGFSVSYGTN